MIRLEDMSEELGEVDFQRFWRRLQQLGLNAYESRSYLVLLGHPKFKALELAARAHVPRQKIYEVLDSLVEKGFAQVVQEKTKLFSAVEPSLAIPGYLSRKRQDLEQELTDNGRAGGALIDDLKTLYSEGQGGRGTLDFLRIVTEPAQTAAEYRRMLMEVKHEYLEFSRPPYAVDPLDEKLVKQAGLSGVACRLLLESASLDTAHRQRLAEYVASGVQVRMAESLPMKLAVFDGQNGHAGAARSGDHAPHVDRRRLPSRRHGRGDESAVRRAVAARHGFVSRTGLPACLGQTRRSVLLFKSQAGAAQVDFVAGAEFFAAAIAGGDYDGAAVAEDAGAEFAAVVAEAVVARVQANVGVLAGHGGVGFVGAFFEDDIVAAHHAMVGIGEFDQASDVGPRPFPARTRGFRSCP